MTRPVFAAAAVLLFVSTAASAQPPGQEGFQWSLGAAVISSPEPYVGADNETIVVPALSLAYQKFFFRGITAGYELFEREGFSASVIARARFAGYDAGDSPFLAGMEDRRKSADLGLELDWQPSRRIGFQLTPVTDVLGRSDGQEVAFDVYVPLRWGPARIEPRVGVLWQSSDFVDYYYGVRPEEARPGRPAFQGEPTVNLGAGVVLFTPVARRLVLQSFVRVERLGDEIEESPIVDRKTAVTGFAALSYSF
ncbi:MAG TPA: MipA/OmpV family protein [Thermoanaerobaculia bacterium]